MQWVYSLTSRDKEDSSTEDDIVSAPVKLTGSHTQTSHEQKPNAHDGEDAGRSHCSWGRYKQTQPR